ncbi:hypothetical protein [Alkalihalobacillus sp. LMS39]|uniref:hypothetical protein n=1 Tax=Alkalihalobacillus sp. LMS39 TaxID=2924032 RepID=UPI001FB28BF2|nr:hypothetical protein [Alkalihalobacillus sp. LMS39]UOE95088.1 hypothetical protein MM271_05515 [Alkalihalobacillus sp. LMS39]
MAIIDAKLYNHRMFDEFDSAYWGFSSECLDGNMYFSLCTHKPNKSAGIFQFDINKKEIKYLFSIDEKIKNNKLGSTPHGKVHTNLFLGIDNKYYFGTHFAYPNCIPQSVNYEGGRLLGFDPCSGLVEDHGVLIEGEGIVTMIIDKNRMHCYILTSPSGYFVDYSINNRKIYYSSKLNLNGESICRSLGLDNNGIVYGCKEGYQVFKYDYRDQVFSFINTNFSSISPEVEEWNSVKKQGANKVGRKMWRCIEFDHETNVFYGINAADSSLFKFNKETNQFENVAKLNKLNTKSVYPNLTLSKNKNNFYYLPSDGKFDYKLSEEIESTSTLISFNSKTKDIKDHGSVYGLDNLVIFGAASAMCYKDGSLYLIGAVKCETIKEQNEYLKFDKNYFKIRLIEITKDSLSK